MKVNYPNYNLVEDIYKKLRVSKRKRKQAVFQVVIHWKIYTALYKYYNRPICRQWFFIPTEKYSGYHYVVPLKEWLYYPEQYKEPCEVTWYTDDFTADGMLLNCGDSPKYYKNSTFWYGITNVSVKKHLWNNISLYEALTEKEMKELKKGCSLRVRNYFDSVDIYEITDNAVLYKIMKILWKRT